MNKHAKRGHAPPSSDTPGKTQPKKKNRFCTSDKIEEKLVPAQLAQAQYMSSSLLTSALLRDSSDLHIYKDLYWERNKPEKNEKLPLNHNKNCLPEFQCRFLCVLCFSTDLERFSVV